MFITKKHISRRAVLKGAGVSLALPFLEAMVPAATALAQTAAAPKLRVGFFYLPHGAIMANTKHGAAMDRWTPSGSGADFKLNTIMASLEPYKKYLTSFGNLGNKAAEGGTHPQRPATWLSCTAPSGQSMAPTLDQIIAGRIGRETQLQSLQISSETTVQQAAGNGGPYTTLSFRDATSPLPMEYNQRKILEELFGNGDLAAMASIERQRGSLLDLVRDQTRALQGDLGPADRAVLDSHLESVRQVEVRVEQEKDRQAELERIMTGVSGDVHTLFEKIPKGALKAFDDFNEQVEVMFDLIALAYQTDRTHVVSCIMAAEGTNQTYGHIGVPDSFHPVSHHADDLEKINKLVKIQTWHTEKFAQFLARMAATPDGQGTLLDHSVFMYGSNMSNSSQHSSYPLPTMIVGGGNGKLKQGGQHLMLPEHTPIANLHLTLLNKAGIEQDKFADSTGTIAEL